jgi:hypothetical protein
MTRKRSLAVLAVLSIALAAGATVYVADIQGGEHHFKQQAVGTTPALCADQLGTTSYQMCIFAALSAAGYNPLVSANDSAIIFNGGSSGTGALFIGPHSSSSVGLRMTNTGTTFSGSTQFTNSVGIGTSPSAKFHVLGGSLTTGSTLSSTSISDNPAGANTNGNDYTLGTFRGSAIGNGIAMNIRTRNIATVTNWTQTQVGLSFDVDSSEGAGGQIWFGNITGAGTGAGLAIPSPLLLGNSTNKGSCTLNAASPSVCTATVIAGSTCVATNVGAGVALAWSPNVSLSGTTLSIHGANAAANVVNYHCL